MLSTPPHRLRRFKYIHLGVRDKALGAIAAKCEKTSFAGRTRSGPVAERATDEDADDALVKRMSHHETDLEAAARRNVILHHSGGFLTRVLGP